MTDPKPTFGPKRPTVEAMAVRRITRTINGIPYVMGDDGRWHYDPPRYYKRPKS